MAKDPVVHSSPAAIGSRLQVESVAGRLTVTTLGDKLTAAGVAAVAAVIDTYLNSTLSAAQRTALSATTGDNYVTISAGRVFVAVAPGTEAALSALIVAALKTAGNTVAG